MAAAHLLERPLATLTRAALLIEGSLELDRATLQLGHALLKLVQGSALAVDPGDAPVGVLERLLRLDAQLLLGVLLLLDAPELQLALGQALGAATGRLLGLEQALLQAREMGLERLDRGLSRLGAAQQPGVPGLRGAHGAALGEQVALAALRRPARRRLRFFGDHRVSVRLPPDAMRPAQGRLRRRQAMRDCSENSSMKPGEAVCENSPPEAAKLARLAS